MTELKFMSCNVRGLADTTKRKQVYNYLKDQKVDIVFLQETHTSKNSKRIFKSQWRGKSVFANGTGGARGVGILFASNLEVNIVKAKIDDYGRYILCSAVIDNKQFLLVNIYAPNEDDPQFYEDIFNQIVSFNIDYVIVGGDLNVHLTELDKKGSQWKPSKSSEIINVFLEQNSWVDIWRYTNQDRFAFTWRKTKPSPSFSRLDYFLIPEGLIDYTMDSDIVPGFLSDHSFISLTLKISTSLKGPGYWKLNTSHLNEKDFVDGINTLIDRSEQRYSNSDPINRLEFLKFDVREFAREYAIERSKIRKNKLGELKNKARSLHKKLNIINLKSEKAVSLIEKINKKLDIINIELDKDTRYIVQGQMLRLKVKWVEEAERNTKYFYSLEKYRSRAKSMNKIISNGKLITKQEEILKEQSKFYQQLYAKDDSVKFDMKLSNQSSSKLDDTQKVLLDSEITLEEIGEAIKEMPRNKAPGLDGLNADFYKVFYVKIKHLLLQVYNKCKKQGKMHNSARQGVISLIPKQNRDRNFLTSWRPISLLNVDFKIISKILASRMKLVLDGIIDPEQTGFVKGRNISENIRKFFDLIELTDLYQIPAIVVQVDLEKAFDRVDYDALFKIMEFFNFGQEYIGWIRTLFEDFHLATVNNGYVSEFFVPTRGLFQGNPIAPYLFLLISQVLVLKLKENPKVEGIESHGIRALLSLFADDLGLFLKFKQSAWAAAMSDFDLFESNTGMKISYDKTIIYRIGSLKNSDAKFYSSRKIKWTNEPINILGIHVSHDEEQCFQLNFEPIIKKAESILKNWESRGLTLVGKVEIINTLIASLFVYRCSVLPILPQKILKQVDELIKRFLWGDTKSKISQKILQGLKTDGGLGLVDLKARDAALKAAWVFRIQENSDLKQLAYTLINNPMGDDFWNSQLTTKDIVKLFPEAPSFWRDVMISWFQTNWIDVESKNQILTQPIWLNSYIRQNNKPFFNKILYSKGLKKVGDIFNVNGTFLNIAQFQEKFKSQDFVTYHGLIHSIPTHWKTLIKTTDGKENKNLLAEWKDLRSVVGVINRYKKGNPNLLIDKLPKINEIWECK